MPLITKYQTYLLVESVVIDEETGDSIPDSREEIHCEPIHSSNYEDNVFDVVYAIKDMIDSAQTLTEKLTKDEYEETSNS